MYTLTNSIWSGQDWAEKHTSLLDNKEVSYIHLQIRARKDFELKPNAGILVLVLLNSAWNCASCQSCPTRRTRLLLAVYSYWQKLKYANTELKAYSYDQIQFIRLASPPIVFCTLEQINYTGNEKFFIFSSDNLLSSLGELIEKNITWTSVVLPCLQQFLYCVSNLLTIISDSSPKQMRQVDRPSSRSIQSYRIVGGIQSTHRWTLMWLADLFKQPHSADQECLLAVHKVSRFSNSDHDMRLLGSPCFAFELINYKQAYSYALSTNRQCIGRSVISLHAPREFHF